MKNRFITYFLFLPLAVLLSMIHQVDVSYLNIGLFVICFAVLFAGIVRTFYKKKKFCFFLSLLILCFFSFNGIAYAQYGLSMSGVDDSFVDPFTFSSYIDREAKQAEEMGDTKRAEQIRSGGALGTITGSTTLGYGWATATKTNSEKCPNQAELYQDLLNNCWACQITDLFLEAGDKVASSVYKTVQQKGYALGLLVIGFFGWILLTTLKLIMSLGLSDTSKYFADLFKKALLVGCVALLLQVSGSKMVDFFVSPFFMLSSSIGQRIKNSVEDPTGNDLLSLMARKYGQPMSCSYCDNLGKNVLPDAQIRTSIGYSASLSDRFVSPLLRNSMLCSVCTTYQATVLPSAIGQFLYCSAKKSFGILTFWKGDWAALIIGLALIFSFFLLSTIFAFYFLDAFFRICIVLVLFPFMLIAFCFETTKRYTKQAISILIHSMVTMIMLTLMATLLLQIFYSFLGNTASDLVNAFSSDNAYEELKDLIGFKNGGLLLFSCIGLVFIIFFVLQQMDFYISELTGISFSNSGGMDAVKTIGFTVAAAGAEMQMLARNVASSSTEENNAIKEKSDSYKDSVDSASHYEGSSFEKDKNDTKENNPENKQEGSDTDVQQKQEETTENQSSFLDSLASFSSNVMDYSSKQADKGISSVARGNIILGGARTVVSMTGVVLGGAGYTLAKSPKIVRKKYHQTVDAAKKAGKMTQAAGREVETKIKNATDRITDYVNKYRKKK